MRQTISELAMLFIQQHRDLCDALLRHARAFATHYEYALQERESFLRCILALRDAARKFAERHLVDAKRLLISVGLRLGYSRMMRVADKRLLYYSLRSNYISVLERYNIDSRNHIFEDISVAARALASLRFCKNDDKAVLRDKIRALTLHYASLTSISDAVVFLRDLASKLEQLL